jgi:hypothetical protein
MLAGAGEVVWARLGVCWSVAAVVPWSTGAGLIPAGAGEDTGVGPGTVATSWLSGVGLVGAPACSAAGCWVEAGDVASAGEVV